MLPLEIIVQERRPPTPCTGKAFSEDNAMMVVFGYSYFISNVVEFDSREDVPWVQLEVRSSRAHGKLVIGVTSDSEWIVLTLVS